MTGPTVMEFNEAGFWMAGALERAAQWREGKAAEFPEDGRNVRAEKALRSAAKYVSTTLHRSPGIKRIATLVTACRESGIDLLAAGPAISPLPGVESERVASRYFFDNGRTEPDELTHEELLRDMYLASLRDVSTDYGWETEPDSSLGKLLRHEAIIRDTPTDPLLLVVTEIRDLLRDHLKAA